MAATTRIRLLDEKGPQRSPASDWVTIDLDLPVGGALPARLAVLPGAARLSDLVPAARALASRLACRAIERLHAAGLTVPCCKGCKGCCRYLVPLSIPEAARIAEEIRNLPDPIHRAFAVRFLTALEKLLASDPPPTDADEPGADALSRWYADLDITCPLLTDSICAFYDGRPIACREHMVTSEAGACDGGCPRPVPPSVSILEALGELSAEMEGGDVEAVMLPLAPVWAYENVARATRTWPAVELVEAFSAVLQRLAQAGTFVGARPNAA